MEENIEETFTFYRLPAAHHKHLKSTNMLERLNQELKRRTHIVRILVVHEEWLEAVRYLDMDVLKEHRKLLLQKGMEPVSETVA